MSTPMFHEQKVHTQDKSLHFKDALPTTTSQQLFHSIENSKTDVCQSQLVTEGQQPSPHFKMHPSSKLPSKKLVLSKKFNPKQQLLAKAAAGQTKTCSTDDENAEEQERL